MSGTWVTGTPLAPTNWVAHGIPSPAPPPGISCYPNPNDVNNTNCHHYPHVYIDGGNPYVQYGTASASSEKSSADMISKVLDRCGKTLEITSRKAGSVWQQLKTSPNLTEAAIAKITYGTKVFAEGGLDKIFQQTFSPFPGEKLIKAFACYISTSSAPLIGTLYLSTKRIAFCSDNPVYQNSSSQGQCDIRYYKIVVLLDQVMALNPSANRFNLADKYIQIVTMDGYEFWFMKIVTMDGYEFWFMGFMSYDKAVRNLKEALRNRCALNLQQKCLHIY